MHTILTDDAKNDKAKDSDDFDGRVDELRFSVATNAKHVDSDSHHEEDSDPYCNVDLLLGIPKLEGK